MVDVLSTIVGGTVVVTSSGIVKVKRKADPLWTEDDNTLKELLKYETGSYRPAQEAEEFKKEEKENNGMTLEKERKPEEEKAKKL